MSSPDTNLEIAILCLPDKDNSLYIEKITQLLATESNLHLTIFENSNEISQLLNSDTYDLHILCAAAQEETLKLLQRSFNHDLTHGIIAIIPPGKRDLGLQLIRAGASDFLDFQHINHSSLDKAIKFAHSHSNRGFRIARRFAFERLLKNVASSLLNLPVERIEEGISSALQMIGEHTNVDRSYTLLLSEDKGSLSMTHEWCANNVQPASLFFENRSVKDLGILFDRCYEGKVVYYSRLEELPSDEHVFSQLLIQRGVKSFLAAPIFDKSDLIGIVGLSSLHHEQYWSGEVLSLLEFAGEVFSNALQRKKAHVALSDSEKRFRTLIEGLGEGILYCDREDTILHINTSFCDMTGYTLEEAIGRKAFDLFLPVGDEDKLRSMTNRRLQGISESYELLLKRKDGSTFWSRIAATPIRNSSGEVVATLGAVTDISENRKAHDELKRQKEFLSLVIDTNPSLIYAKDLEKRFVLVNQALADLYGMTKEQMIGKTVSDIYSDPELIARFDDQDQKIISSKESIVFSEDSISINGETQKRWFQTTKKPLLSQSGEVIQILGVSSDLTARRRSEEALKAVIEGTAATTAEEFFRSLVRHLAKALGTDSAFLGTITDPSMKRIDTVAQWLAGEYRANSSYNVANSPSEQVIKHGFFQLSDIASSKYRELEIFKELGTQSFMGSALYDSSGAVSGILAVFDSKNLSDWDMARYILGVFAARASAELQRMKTQQDAIQLQHQLVQAQKMEAIGQLAAGVAHDLNNALSAVVGHLQLMTMKSKHNPDLHDSVKIALSGCERATSLIDQLLGFSRQGLYQPEKLTLQRVINDCIGFLSSVLGSGIRLDLTGTHEELIVSADSNQLHQMFTNLIINAKHAMPEGGTIVLDFASEFVEDPTSRNPKAHPGEYAIVRVCDSGVGIKPEILNKIFEPFFTTKDKEKGTGLGLSMVYGAMQNHGGWIEVESSPGQGAVFSLFFPRLNSAVQSRDSQSSEEKHASSENIIMVVDDEPFLVDLMLKFLENSGHKSKGFTNPTEALEWYQNSFDRVDLVILDMKMPGIDGRKCFYQLKQICPTVKVAILSGYIQDRAAQELLEAGALAFFQKPLKYPDLIEWIDLTLKKGSEQTQESPKIH